MAILMTVMVEGTYGCAFLLNQFNNIDNEGDFGVVVLYL